MFVKEKFKTAVIYQKKAKSELDLMHSLIPEVGNFIHSSKDANAIFVWGSPHQSKLLNWRISRKKLPVFQVDRGFIDRIGFNEESMPSSSLIVDKKGIYSDGRRASDLEYVLQNRDFRKEKLERAKKSIEFIKKHQITRYNSETDIRLSKFEFPVGNNILLLDQPISDSEQKIDFENMYNYAKKVFPNHNIIIKRDAKSIYRKEKGFLDKYQQRVGVFTIKEDVNIHSIITYVDFVFTVGSISGFEAIVSNAKVICFGRPFYAGWGISKDIKNFKRRSRSRSLEEIFAGAYINYTRYKDPYSGLPCEIEILLSVVADLKQKNKNFNKPLYGVGFRYWKQESVRKIFKTPCNSIKFFKNENAAIAKARNTHGEVLVWASKETENLEKKCDEKGVKLKRVEDGFIRSIGIGSDLVPALSLVLDNKGIYYNGSKQSELEIILKSIKISVIERKRAKNLITLINDNSITKYNSINANYRMSFPRDKKIIFVPGQVEDDASILTGKGRIKTNRALLEEARLREPDSFIIFKPHPDVSSGNRKGHLSKREVNLYADLIVNKFDTVQLIKRCDKIYTISSLVGFEGLLKDKEVHTYGTPFYAGWGLTKDENRFPDRKKIDLETLVYGALIEYPRYIDPITNILCSPELLIERISLNKEELENIENQSKRLKVFRFFKNIIKNFKKRF